MCVGCGILDRVADSRKEEAAVQVHVCGCSDLNGFHSSP